MRGPLPAFGAAAALACGMSLAAQAPAPFHVETRLVVLRATVRNARGELVTDLDRQAFTVYENGKPQPITIFRRDDIPVSLGLLIDNSGSMRTRRASVEAAALAFAHASNPLDEMFVVNFADTPRLDVPMTGDVAGLERGIARVDSIGGTAMLDAVGMAEDYLSAHAARDRRVLLIVTDGNDNASVASPDAIERRAGQSGTAVYAIGLLNDVDRSKARQARHVLDRLTESTGGVAYYPATLDAMASAALDIARQIRRQYTIAYAPIDQALDGSYRRIRLTVRGEKHLSVRTREGYYATPDAAPKSTGH